jgi:hypothetical protein
MTCGASMSVTRQIGGSSRGRAKTERQLSVVGFSPSTPVTDSPSSRLPGAYVARTVKSCQPATLDPVSRCGHSPRERRCINIRIGHSHVGPFLGPDNAKPRLITARGPADMVGHQLLRPIHEATQIRPIWRVMIRVHITIRESPDVRILVQTQKTGRRSSEAKSAGSHR